MDLLMITVRTQLEGIHCYPSAPEEVAFLRHPHRHIFHVSAEIEVFHDDRELEFILVKRSIDEFLKGMPELKNASCEMIAKSIREFLKEKYPLPEKIMFRSVPGQTMTPHRLVNIKVSEDGENGVYLREV